MKTTMIILCGLALNTLALAGADPCASKALKAGKKIAALNGDDVSYSAVTPPSTPPGKPYLREYNVDAAHGEGGNIYSVTIMPESGACIIDSIIRNKE